MIESKYKQVVDSAYGGRVLIGVDRAFARRVYTDVPKSRIEELTGEAPHLEKLVVWFAFIAAPVLLVGSGIAAGIAFGWWAALVIPVALLAWMSNKSMSVRGGASMWLPSRVLAATVAAHFFGWFPSLWMSIFAILLAATLWCDRLLYWASTLFLRAFVIRNRRALAAFSEAIVVREVDEHGS